MRTGESAPREAKMVPSVGKVMSAILWDSRGADRLPGKRQDHHYVSLVNKLKGAIQAKRPHLLFHHNITPVTLRSASTCAEFGAQV